MFATLARIGNSGRYWLLLAVMAVSFEAVALYYQYGRGESPCVLCIQVRLWFAALIPLALLVGWLRRLRFVPLAGHVLTAGVAAALLERSWWLLGTERGFAIGECGFDLGLPGWFRPDAWLPALFEVQTTCGYTPVLPLGVSMAEFLLVFSAAFLVFALLMTVAAIMSARGVRG